MIEVASNPLNLPYGIVITQILKANNISLHDIPPLSVKQSYTSKAFGCIGYTRVGDSWILKVEAEVPAVPIPSQVDLPSSSNVAPISSDALSEILEKLHAMDDKIESLKDILLSTQFQMEKVRASMKEIGSDVAKICIKLDKIIQEVVKVATQIQANSDKVVANLVTNFEKLKEATIHTICYLLRK